MSTNSGSLARAAILARLFALLGMSVPLFLNPTQTGTAGLITLAVVWATASLIDPVPHSVVRTVTEAAAVGGICAVTLDAFPQILGALVVVPFCAGIGRGLWGVSAAISTQLIVVVTLSLVGGEVTESLMLEVFSWMMTGLGLGLVASFVHSVTGPSDDDGLVAYREARSLIKELLDVSRDLSSGLDATSLGGLILAEVRDRLPTSAVGLYVPVDDRLMPLVSDGFGEGADLPESLAVEVEASGGLRFEGHSFAFPLTTDSELVAIVAGTLSDELDPASIGFRDTVHDLPAWLMPTTLRLDTALLFATLKHEATADERGRLAREMHDGVAQEIVYLGYLVDALAADPTAPDHEMQLRLLRERITNVVTEVRRSVLTLRTQVGSSESLGAGIGSLARHLGDVSGIPIQVTVDERTTRLRPQVEAELLRIGQEAMNNAVKHAQADQIDVSCRVDPPHVELTVSDNGRGLQGRRSDSHGLTIMRERARLIGADLSVHDRPEGGVQVSVRIGPATEPGRAAASQPTNSDTMGSDEHAEHPAARAPGR